MKFELIRLLLASWLALVVAMSPASAAETKGPPGKDDRTFGKLQVAVFDVDAASLARLRAHKTEAPNPKLSAAENMARAETTYWTGPEQKLLSAKNPYVMVVTLTATALADGDAVSAWQAGWANDDGLRANPVAGLNKLKAKAGERFVVTVSTTPVSFKEDRSLKPVFGLVRSRNLQIESVNVQLWSGMPGYSWQQIFFSLPVLMLGMTMFALWWFLRKRV